MSAEQTSADEMGPWGRAIGVFISPRETFESIDRKPTWLVPFIILSILVFILSLSVMDIMTKYQIELLETRDIPQEQMEVMKDRILGPLKYINLAFYPLIFIIVWLFISLCFWLSGSVVMGGDVKFKNIFSLVAWSGFVADWQGVGSIFKTILTKLKGTPHGVNTSLSIILPTPKIGETPSILYSFLSRFDLFMLWQLAIWIVAISVVFRFSIKKSATMVLSLWAVYIILAVIVEVPLSSIFGG